MKYIYLLFIFMTMQNIATAQNSSGKFTYKAGELDVSLLNENQGMASTQILVDATPEMLDKAVPDRKIPNATNAFLIRTGDKNILVDAGYGSKLFDNLSSLGVAPAQVDIVLITHGHGDHIGGMLKDGEKAFPNAKVYISEKENAYWQNANNALALNVLSAYGDQLVLFVPGTLDGQNSELLPGIKAIEAYGHTPGHTMYLIDSDNQKLLIWGDLTHALAVQMPFPQVAVTYDSDPAQAVKSRIETLKYVDANDIPVAGMHIPFAGMGRVTADKTGGYVFTPLTK